MQNISLKNYIHVEHGVFIVDFNLIGNHFYALGCNIDWDEKCLIALSVELN